MNNSSVRNLTVPTASNWGLLLALASMELTASCMELTVSEIANSYGRLCPIQAVCAQPQTHIKSQLSLSHTSYLELS